MKKLFEIIHGRGLLGNSNARKLKHTKHWIISDGNLCPQSLHQVEDS